MVGYLSKRSRRSNALLFHAGRFAVAVGVLVATAACGSSKHDPAEAGVHPTGGTAGRAAAATGGVGGAPAGTTTTGGSAAGTVETTTGGSSSAAGAMSGGAAATEAGTASTGGATAGTGAVTAGSATTGGSGGASTTTGGATGAPLKAKCESGEVLGCSSFMSPGGAEIPLGKYGAAMDRNVGKGFANPIDAAQEGPLQCSLFVAAFGQSQEETDQVLDTGDLDFGLYSVYRPANWGQGEKYPIISWGNGTCAQPEGYGTLLRYVASHGFVVFAANSRWVGNDNAAAMKRALDFAFGSNMDPKSPYYQKLDTTKVGAMGHSQGGAATNTVSSDSRIGTVILFNGGSKAAKPYMTVSGERDVGGQTAASLRSEVQSMPKAAFLFFHMIPGNGSLDGHLTLMKQPERLMNQTVDWFKMMLAGDATAKANFVGASCGYCGHDTEYEYGQNGL